METTFGNNLKALRNRKGFSQRKLAATINVNHATIASYENGGSIPRKNNIKQKLIDALECTEEELFGYTDGAASEYVEYYITDLVSNTDSDNYVPGCYLKDNKLVISKIKGDAFIGHMVNPDIVQLYPKGFIHQIKDSSMQLTIPKGSYVFIAPTKNLKHADSHVCLLSNGKDLYIRRVRVVGNNVITEPETNDNFSKEFIDLDKDNDFKVYGKVVHFFHGIEGL